MNIASEMRAAACAVESNLERAESTRAARILQAQRLDAEEKTFAAGMSTKLFRYTGSFVPQAQRNLELAAMNELQPIVDYREGLVEFEHVQDAASAPAEAQVPSPCDEDRS